LQIEIVYLLGIVFWTTAFAFTVYLLVKMCTGGKSIRTEKRWGMPGEEDITSTQAAYGAEMSHSSGVLGSAAPFPNGTWNWQGGSFSVGYKEDRPPTRSFRTYVNPRRKEKKD